MNNRVVIFFDDMTEFYAVKNDLDDCIKRGIAIDIVVPKQDTFNHLSEYTYRGIRNLGYKVLREPSPGIKYKVLLEPYGVSSAVKKFEYVYRIKYRYSLMQLNKPMTLEPQWNILYDAIMSYSGTEIDFLSVYSRVELTKPMNFEGFQRTKNVNDKKRLLILPTFGDVSCVDGLTEDVVKHLKEKFHVSIKAHHATQFRDEKKLAMRNCRHSPISSMTRMLRLVTYCRMRMWCCRMRRELYSMQSILARRSLYSPRTLIRDAIKILIRFNLI